MPSFLASGTVCKHLVPIEPSAVLSGAGRTPSLSGRARNSVLLKWMGSCERSIFESQCLDTLTGRPGYERKNDRKPLQAQMASEVTEATNKVNLDDRNPETLQAISQSLSNCLTETHLDETVPGLGPRIRGKVRDTYDAGNHLVLVTTDRQSAFDRVLASVPFKGQVLNETSIWWFQNTGHITENAFVSAPDPNVTIARKCTVFPVEFVEVTSLELLAPLCGLFTTKEFATIVAIVSQRGL